MLTGNYKTIKRAVKRLLSLNHAVFVHGHPGVGKSHLARELAKEFGLRLIDLRISQMDPTELAGSRLPDKETGRLRYYPPDWAPVDEPAFLFLDEFNVGITKLHQSVAYQIVLDRCVGPAKFHPGTKIMAAGNLAGDGSIVVPLSSALNNRFAHFILEPDVECWLEWAKQAGISPATRAYVKFKGINGLFKLPKDVNAQLAFPTPRSLEKVDEAYRSILAEYSNSSKQFFEELREVATAHIGEAAAAEYVTFIETYSHVDIEEVIRTGEIRVRKEDQKPGFLCALIYGIASYIENNMKPKDIEQSGLAKLLKQPQLTSDLLAVFFNEIKDKPEIFNVVVKMIANDKELMSIVNGIIEDKLAVEKKKKESLRR